MAEERAEGSITTPVGSVNFKGKNIAEFVAILCLALLFLMGYVIHEHKEDAKQAQVQFVTAINGMTSAQRENNIIAREQLCLLALGPDERKREFMSETGFCKRLSRER